MLGQDEYYDFYNPGAEDVSPDYYYYEEPSIEEWPSEARYVETYQAQQEAIQSQVESGSGFFDIFKSIVGLATPVVTSIIRAGQDSPTTYVPTTSIGLPVRTTTQTSSLIASLTSSPLLLIGLGVGGFLLLRNRR